MESLEWLIVTKFYIVSYQLLNRKTKYYIIFYLIIYYYRLVKVKYIKKEYLRITNNYKCNLAN
jgi:hypothetical protein